MMAVVTPGLTSLMDDKSTKVAAYENEVESTAAAASNPEEQLQTAAW